MRISLIFFFILAIYSVSIEEAQQCWVSNIAHAPQINQEQTSHTSKFEFSLHQTTGQIFNTRKDKSNSVFFGDLSTVRVYGENKTINIFEGLMLRVAIPAPHTVPESSEVSMEIQILHKMAFGKYKYEYIGVSHIFKASEDVSENLGLQKQLKELNTGKNFLISRFHPFEKKSQNIDKIFVYRLNGCNNKILWLVRQNAIKISLQEFEEIKEIFGNQQSKESTSETIKVYAAKLRTYLEKNISDSESPLDSDSRQEDEL